MKKYIFALMLMTLGLSSCTGDFLNMSPSDQTTTKEAVTTLDDVKNAVNGLYALMASTYYYDASMFLYGDVKGDDIQPTYWSSGRTAYPFYFFDHSASVPNSGGLWGRPYYIIRNAFNILKAIDDGKVSGGEEQLNEYKGEALACIALCYFDLTRVYGYPYAKDNGASPGVPLLDHAINYGETVDRNSVAECYDYIIDKLETAIPLLSTSRNDGHINAYAARALLARAYLYCGKNKEAFGTADKLIADLKATGLYQLADHDHYVDMFAFSNKFGSEALFQISNTTTANPGRDGLSYLLHWWGYAAVILTDDFAQMMKNDPNDVRGQLVATYQDSGDGLYYNLLLKYPGEKGYNVPSFDNNYTVIRLSEVYLIAAEAGLKAGGELRTYALAYLNDIVKRANPSAEVADADFTLDRVLLEREKELVGEGHRYFDMLRNGKTIVRKGGKHLQNAPQEINWDYDKCVLPISRDEFTFNPNMAQNEGYTKE